MKFKTCYSAIYSDVTPWNKLVEKVVTISKPDQITEKNSFLVLHGGADISPSLYGEKIGKYTYAPNRPSYRDTVEVALAKRAIEMDIPIIGICRGAQLMCVLNGGKLVQDVEYHNGYNHKITTYDGKTVVTNSVHHQQMYPWFTNYELIAWAEGVGTNFTGQNGEEIVFPPHAYHGDKHMDVMEPEIVWFPKTKAFCVQGHPEWAKDLPDFQKYVVEQFIERV